MRTTDDPPRRPRLSGRMLLPGVAVAATFSSLTTLSCEEEPTVPPEPEPASIAITPDTALLNLEVDSVQLSAVVRDEDGEVISGLPISWLSSDVSVATVSDSGLVHGVSNGEATITAMADSLKATASITSIVDPDRFALEGLYNAANGPGWFRNGGWLTDAPLSEWYGVEVDGQGRVAELLLGFNGIEGPILPELGMLDMLRVLDFSFNRLEGPIPPEFGQLEMLESLDFTYNDVKAIPAELTTLPRLRTLLLYGTGLEGRLPAALANLPELRDLDLSLNDFTGPTPSRYFDMPHLANLALAFNSVTGSLPEDIGNTSTLKGLNLTSTGMSGTLPLSLTEIAGLDSLLTGGTRLCAPADERFRLWLRGVQRQRVRPCAGLANESSAYLTQEVQSRLYSVPLVADEDALLRVFVVAPKADGEGIPPIRATFYVDGMEEKVVEFTPDSSFIRDRVYENSLASSANALIPASVIRPGLEMVVEIDPDGTLDPDLEVAKRIPGSGRIDVDVRELPVLPLTLIPFLYAPDPDSSLLDLTDGMTAEDTLLWAIRTLMPVHDLDLTVHEPVATNSTSGFALQRQTEAIRVAEDGKGYYQGLLPESQAGFGGVSTYGVGWSSFSIPDSWVMVHELGHNLGLLHAPCGRNLTDTDPAFPQGNGSIGAWGYRFADSALVRPSRPDFMSYCGPDVWVSEFFYSNMLRYRFELGDLEKRERSDAAGPSLLVWGGLGPDGAPFLEPAFVLDAAPALPLSAGPYSVTGIGSDGTDLFSLSFDMPATSDGEGGSSFAFVVPARTSWEGDLVRIILAGPDRFFALEAGTHRPAVIVRDPDTGRVRAILRDLPATMTRTAAAALSPEPGLEVLFSRGLPDAAEWARR